jgi:peptide chain release factor subunit 3
MGKIEAGTLRVGDKVTLMPNDVTVKVLEVQIKDTCVASARPGENVRVKVNTVTESDVSKGFVLCARADKTPVVQRFECSMVIMDLLEHRPLLTAGYNAILHVHTAIEECQVEKLLTEVDRKTNEPKSRRPKFVRSGAQLTCVMSLSVSVCLEEFKVMRQLGRFTLRDEGRTIAIGTVTKILPDKSSKN